MAKSKTEMEVNIGANIKDLVKAIEEAKKLISSLSDSFKQGLKLAVDVKNIKSEIKDVKNEIKSELIAKPFKVNVEVDSNKLKSNIKTSLREAIKEINTQGINSKLKLPTAPKMKITVDTSSARTSIRNLKNMLQKNEVRINTGKAEGDIIRLSTYMNQLASKKVTPQIDTSKAEQAKLSIAELATYMNQLQSKKIKIDISFENKDIVNNLKDIDSLLKSIQKNSSIKLNVNATGRASGGGGVQSQLQQYRTLRQEARHFALEAEKAWTVGNKQGFEQNRQNFLVAMKDLADFSRQLGNLSASREAGMYSNMLRSLQQTSPLYNDILNKIKQLKKEQKDFNDLISDGNKKLKQDTPRRTKDNRPGFTQGTVGASAYVIHYLGRSSKGFGSFGEATSQLITDINSLGGSMSKLMVPVAALAGTIAITVTAFTAAIKGIEFFGGLLKQIGQEVYNALKPGIELYKQQTSAFFSFTASFMSNGILSDKANGDKKLSSMTGGRDIASSLSLKLLRQAQIDAETSAFSLQDILASLQGTLPILMSHGMTADQAYEINKGVAAVAKMIQLTPSQILQETRDLAQGSITSRGSQVANALGITNADLKKYEGDAEGLYSFLIGKFEQYKDLLTEFEDTALGRWQQFQERWQTVARNIVEGTLPQFKGLFEGLIEYTGEWQSKYIDQAGNENLAKLNAMTGKWQDAVTGMELPDFKPSDAFFKLSEPFEKIQKILPEIVKHLAETIDEIIQFIEEETGISDPIELAKQAIDFLIDGFKLSVKVLVELISTLESIENILKTFEPILVPIINVIRSMGNGFLFVVSCVNALISGVRLAVATVRELWNAVWNENDAWSKAQQKEALNSYIASGSKVGKSFEDWMNMEYYDSYDSMFKSLKQRKNKKFTTFEDFISKYASGELNVKNTDKNLVNLRGKQKESSNAQKEAIKQSQKELKARLAELKAALKDALDELKNILSKNKIAYEEGFMTLDEYLKAEAQASVDEATLKLEEAKAERELIKNALYTNEEDRNKALADNEKNINIYTRELKNAQLGYKEVSSKWIDSAKSVVKALDEFGRNVANMNKAGGVGAKPVKSASQVASVLGVNESVVDAIIKTAQKYGVDPRVMLALANQESGFNQNVTSPAGAIGVMQLMPSTAESLGVNPYDTYENIEGGVKYLAQQLEIFSGDIRKALAAYNAGPKAVKKYGGVPPYAETQNYVSTIMSSIGDYEDTVSNIASNMTDVIGGLILSAASDQVEKGVPYVWGGTTLDEGVDCSGLVYAIWNQLYGQAISDLNTAFPRTADLQAVGMDKVGAFFDDANMLQIGDLVFFRGGDPGEMGVGHVGIYAGDNKFIEAQKTGTNVKYSNLADRSDIVGYGDVRKYFESLGLQVDRSGLDAEAYRRLAASQTEKGHNRQKLIEEQTKELEEVLLKYGNSFVGNYREALYVAQARHDREVKKVKNANLLKKEDLEARLQMTDELYQKEVLDIQTSALEALADFNTTSMDLDSDIVINEIKAGRQSFAEYIYRISEEASTVNEQEEYWLGNQIEMLENLANAYEAKGYVAEAQKIREKVIALKRKPYEIAEKALAEVSEFFDRQQNLFDATEGFTDLQREFGTREIKAYKAQAEYEAYSVMLMEVNKELNETNQKLAKAQDLLKSLAENTEDWKKAQADVNTLSANKSRLESLQKEYEYQKRLNDLQRKQPEYMRDLRNAAYQGLENGLVTFLTDGITEAESLKDALLDLAKTFLKEIQQVSAKWLVKSLMTKITGQFEMPTPPSVDSTNVANAVNTGSMAVVEAIHGLQYALTGTGQYSQGLTSDYVKTNILAKNGLSEPYQNSFTLSALQNSKFGANNGQANNYSFDYASLGLQKLGESANNAGQTALPSFTSGLTDSMNSITNTTTTSVTSFIDSQLTNSLTQLATNAQNAANALSMLSNMSGATGHATGGYISGPGTSTSDSIPAMLSNGEFVLRSDAVRRYGTNFLNALNEGKLSKIKSRLPHFASGGMISDVAQDSTIRGVSNFGKSMASNINNVNNFSVALVRDEKEGMRELLKSPEGQRLLLDFSKKYARFTSIL